MSLTEFAHAQAAEPFRIAIPDSDLDDLLLRLGRTRWPHHLDDPGWYYGTDPAYLKQIVEYWATSFDWRRQEGTVDLTVFPA